MLHLSYKVPLEAGADDYLIKPFSARELLARVEATLKLSQMRQEAARREQVILERVTDAFIAFDRDFRYTYVNPAAARLTQKTPDELLGKTLWEVFPDTIGSRFESEYRRALFEQVKVEFEEYYQPYDMWVEVHAYPSSSRLSLYYRNISDRKRAEQALHQSEEQSRKILESITDAFFALDRNWRFTYVNQTAYTLVDRTPGDLIGKIFWEEFPGVSDSKFEQMHRRVMRDRVAESLTEFYPDHQRWYEVRSYPAANGITMYFRDVTDQIQAAAALRESEARLRFMLDASQIGEWDLDLTTEPHTAHRSLRHDQIFGYESLLPEWSYRIFLDRVHPDDRTFVNETFQQTLSSNTNWNFECRIVHADGSIHWIWVRSSVYCDSTGKPTRLLGIVIDITDRKRAEEDRDRFFQLSRDMLAIINMDGYFLQANPAWTETLGYTAQELSAQPYIEFVHPEDRAMTSNEAQRLAQGIPTVGFENRYRCRDGSYRWISWSVAPFIEQKILYCVARDVTDRKAAEQEREQLLVREQAAREQAEAANRIKDEFLAVLSHELRSPLNPILGWVKLLRSRKFDAQATDRALETIERNAKLQTQLIEDLLDVSRILQGKMALNIASIDLTTTIEAAIETVRLAARAKNIQIQTQFAPKVGLVAGDANRLQQIVWNLLSNASKFTPSGGRIEVSLVEEGSREYLAGGKLGAGEKNHSPLTTHHSFPTPDSQLPTLHNTPKSKSATPEKELIQTSYHTYLNTSARRMGR
ncbi:MAG: Sensor histidine kinase RcsC [Chroococcidiopsis sp. SAG 2025]|nr:PAS domain S-box protein [Chroococcidiopsis sp. SAG 2025]MDV2992456.1 Sensor histidine kinase RcsC [Chroococcidiopsis sp. SAG 2025]